MFKSIKQLWADFEKADDRATKEVARRQEWRETQNDPADAKACRIADIIWDNLDVSVGGTLRYGDVIRGVRLALNEFYTQRSTPGYIYVEQGYADNLNKQIRFQQETEKELRRMLTEARNRLYLIQDALRSEIPPDEADFDKQYAESMRRDAD